MKKMNLKNSFKKICLTAITSIAACLIFGANVYPSVASAEEVSATNTVTIDVTVKETQDVYSIELTKEENGEYVAHSVADDLRVGVFKLLDYFVGNLFLRASGTEYEREMLQQFKSFKNFSFTHWGIPPFQSRGL